MATPYAAYGAGYPAAAPPYPSGYGSYYGAYPGYEAYYGQQAAYPAGPYQASNAEQPPAPSKEQENAQGVPPPPPSPPQDTAPGAAQEQDATSKKAASTPRAPSTATAGSADSSTSAYDMTAYQQYYNQYYTGMYGNQYGAYPQGQYPPHAGYNYQGYPPAAGGNAYPQPPAAQAPNQNMAERQLSIQERAQMAAMQINAQAAAQKQGNYNAVPPPSALTASQRVGNNQPTSIRPQLNLTLQKRTNLSTATPPAFQNPTSTSSAQRTASNAAPAYHAVPTAKPVTTATKPSTGSAGSGKFPPTFTAWVERCFDRCRVDSERQEMTAKLTVRIKEAEQHGRMWLVDWDKEPIPTLGSSGKDAGAEITSAGTPQAGLRSKRSRWEESASPMTQQNAQQFSLQQGKQNKKQKQGKKGKGKDLQEETYSWSNLEDQKRLQRAGRFGDGSAAGGVQDWRKGGNHRHTYYDEDDDNMRETDDEDSGFDASSIHIQGTCAALEKSYFRLTAPPEPSAVRPAPVLRKALDRLVGLIRQGAVNHFYACDQFKGMRQDCTVQHLRNELAVAVYEAHARESLEYGDLAEFNQCQTQLAAMYADGIQGCSTEFLAYKILYNTVHAGAGAGKALLHTLKGALSQAAGQDQKEWFAVKNALAARAAVFTADYPAFFKAYAAAPALGRAILDALAPRIRWACLNVLVKAYKTSIPVSFIAHMLGFVAAPGEGSQTVASEPLPGCKHAVYAGKAAGEQTEEEGSAACAAWLQAHGAVLEAADTLFPLLDVKASMGKLFIPEEPKVAHGDENLSLSDFLARASGLAA